MVSMPSFSDAALIATSISSMSGAIIFSGCLIHGIQLFTSLITASPLSNASGLRTIKSSFGDIANTGNSFVSGHSITSSS